jgi:hypothetical protein
LRNQQAACPRRSFTLAPLSREVILPTTAVLLLRCCAGHLGPKRLLKLNPQHTLSMWNLRLNQARAFSPEFRRFKIAFFALSQPEQRVRRRFGNSTIYILSILSFSASQISVMQRGMSYRKPVPAFIPSPPPSPPSVPVLPSAGRQEEEIPPVILLYFQWRHLSQNLKATRTLV